MKLPHRLASIALAFGLLLGAAEASAAVCTNDVDCPGTACGDQVCSWATASHACVPAGTDPQGSDGWCTSDTDCKCMGQGATCAGVHCTFTLPDAGASTADASVPPVDAGTTGGGDDGGVGGTDAGPGGLVADSGASTTRADSGAGDAGDSSGGGDSGGCSLGAAGSSTSFSAFGAFAAIGLVGLFARRRRSR